MVVMMVVVMVVVVMVVTCVMWQDVFCLTNYCINEETARWWIDSLPIMVLVQLTANLALVQLTHHLPGNRQQESWNKAKHFKGTLSIQNIKNFLTTKYNVN